MRQKLLHNAKVQICSEKNVTFRLLSLKMAKIVLMRLFKKATLCILKNKKKTAEGFVWVSVTCNPGFSKFKIGGWGEKNGLKLKIC